ncbi:MAG: histidine phosphatase family protein [Candidatus Doudnabacteria bacterium]|nr:histidine phosphatase family protein [Candidatus Doudnabacteria bacterium]
MEQAEKYTTIYIVRHGETEHNLNEIMQGQSDSPLTANGQAQAKAREEDLGPVHFDALFSSDLGRTVQTASILNINRKLALNTTKLLREKHFGIYEGRPIQHFLDENKELIEKFEKLSAEEKIKFKYHPTQENDEEVTVRMLTFLREIGATFIDHTVLVVSHGSIMRALLRHLGFATYGELPPGSLENTGYIKLETDGVDFFIKETKGINKVIAS